MSINAITSVPKIDLEKAETFNKKIISGPDAVQRQKILEAKSKALKDLNQSLTPRSKSELDKLDDLFLRDDEIIYREKIERDVGEWYMVEINVKPEAAKIKSFNKLNGQITALSNSLALASPVSILKSLINPQQGMEWYQAATLAQMDVVFRQDFIEGLKMGYIAGLGLLIAARTLYKDPTVFKEIVHLHKTSFDLYEDQVDLNRNCEIQLLAHSKIAQRHLTQMRDLIMNSCGPKLDLAPQEFLDKSNAIVKLEGEKTIELLQEIEKSAQTFLDKLKPLQKGIDTCIITITKASSEVAEINKKFRDILSEKGKIEIQKREIEEKYNKFQKTKDAEWKTRKVEEIKTEKKVEGGFWVFSWDKTVTETHTQISQADFGSSALWDDFTRVRNEGIRIENEINKLEGELKSQLQKHTGSYSSSEEFQSAAQSLAQALIAVERLASATKIKKKQANRQIRFIKSQFGDSEKQPISNVQDALYFLESLRDKILNGHAIWLQSNKICHLTQAVRGEETALSIELTKEIETKEKDALLKAEKQIQVLALNNTHISKKMLGEKELLQIMESKG